MPAVLDTRYDLLSNVTTLSKTHCVIKVGLSDNVCLVPVFAKLRYACLDSQCFKCLRIDTNRASFNKPFRNCGRGFTVYDDIHSVLCRMTCTNDCCGAIRCALDSVTW